MKRELLLKYKKDIAESLAKARRERSLTQGQLVEEMNQRLALDLSAKTISSWENAINSIDHSYMPILAQILDIPLHELYGKKADPLTLSPELMDYLQRAPDQALEEISDYIAIIRQQRKA